MFRVIFWTIISAWFRWESWVKFIWAACVSPGYVNLPRQTSEKFLENPFDGGRLYRTGDLGRLLPNGGFEVLGRIDNQVKLKGYRIELEEVSEVIMQHPPVTAAAVIVKDKSHLVAYFTPADCDVDEACPLGRFRKTVVLPDVPVPQDVLDSIEQEWKDRLDVTRCTVFPVTPLQAGMISSTMSNPCSYVFQEAFLIDSGLDADVLRATFIKVVETHDILRTTFVALSSGLFQVVQPSAQDLPI
ncbi:hypothetical protein AC1031_000044 [Aphanomyces cochlioides]|nr:hypothetical protein AC1031_000044 [Aphanomyces cochlioides]